MRWKKWLFMETLARPPSRVRESQNRQSFFSVEGRIFGSQTCVSVMERRDRTHRDRSESLLAGRTGGERELAADGPADAEIRMNVEVDATADRQHRIDALVCAGPEDGLERQVAIRAVMGD